MGEQQVSIVKDDKQMQQFVWHLLRDVQALEQMLEKKWFEDDIVRIGAEQEMALVDTRTFKPALIAMEALEKLNGHENIGTELAKFNLETNLTPLEFTGDCLSAMEKENWDLLQLIREAVKPMNADVCLTGILPTLRKHDLDLVNLTPKDRYKALMAALSSNLKNDTFELRLSGIDELSVKHDSPLLEACNTSFQVHLQVSPDEFVKMYNIAQTLIAPVTSISANSPMVFGKRLWHETRIALFQQSLDTRTSHDHMRESSPRVSFGKDWLRNSITDIYKEDIARFRVLLGDKIDEDSLAMVQKDKVPKLRALQIHNSTVYRWNRPCYGISPNGKPHLRIECRVLPAGPSSADEMANAAFWLGCMIGMAEKYDDISQHLNYEDLRDNFSKAARYGIDTTFNWVDDRKVTVTELIKNELLPLARRGLELRNIDKADIDHFLGIIEARNEKHMTGARWQLRAFSRMRRDVSNDESLAAMTAAMMKNQWEGKPVHEWNEPSVDALSQYSPANLKVEEFMETDVFTVHRDDIIELVSQMMDWRRLSYMPVEDRDGKLVGLVTSRLLLRHMSKGVQTKSSIGTVSDIMITEPITVSPDATIVEAMDVMRRNKIGCLPVVKKGELIGIITEMDFLRISSRLIDRLD